MPGRCWKMSVYPSRRLSHLQSFANELDLYCLYCYVSYFTFNIDHFCRNSWQMLWCIQPFYLVSSLYVSSEGFLSQVFYVFVVQYPDWKYSLVSRCICFRKVVVIKFPTIAGSRKDNSQRRIPQTGAHVCTCGLSEHRCQHSELGENS